MKVEFDAIPSGDYECFCWAVDHETFIRFEGHEPDRFDKDKFHDGLYRLYPDFCCRSEKHSKVRVTMIVEEIE